MDIHISKEAQTWFQNEMLTTKGDQVRFFVRYGGSSPIQEGFSLGVTKDDPIEASVVQEEQGIIFYIEERDLWYFNGHDLHVDFSDKEDGPTYNYSSKEKE